MFRHANKDACDSFALSHWERSEPKACKGWLNVCFDMNSQLL